MAGKNQLEIGKPSILQHWKNIGAAWDNSPICWSSWVATCSVHHVPIRTILTLCPSKRISHQGSTLGTPTASCGFSSTKTVMSWLIVVAAPAGHDYPTVDQHGESFNNLFSIPLPTCFPTFLIIFAPRRLPVSEHKDPTERRPSAMLPEHLTLCLTPLRALVGCSI